MRVFDLCERECVYVSARVYVCVCVRADLFICGVSGYEFFHSPSQSACMCVHGCVCVRVCVYACIYMCMYV